MSSALGDIGDSTAQVDQARKLQAHAEAKTPYIGSSEHHESGLVTENAHGLIREGVPAPPARPPRLYTRARRTYLGQFHEGARQG